jgi:L-cysteate sulfo-lyase
VVVNSLLPTLHSNIVFLSNFRHPDGLLGPEGYFFVSLMMVVSFIESLVEDDAATARLTHRSHDAAAEFVRSFRDSRAAETEILQEYVPERDPVAVSFPPRVTLVSHAPPVVRELPSRFWGTLRELGSEWAAAPTQAPVTIVHHDSHDPLFAGNEARKMEFVVADALATGAKRLWTSSEAQSDHARTVAATAARFGLECHWLCRTPGGVPPSQHDAAGNFFLARHVLGAVVHFCPLDGDPVEELHRKRVEHDQETGDSLAYEIPETLPRGNWGCIQKFVELCPYFEKQIRSNRAVTRVVCAVESGATLTGLVLGQYLASRQRPELSRAHLQIVGVPVTGDESDARKRICEQVRATVDEFGDWGFESGDFANFVVESEEWFTLWPARELDPAANRSREFAVMRAAGTCGLVLDPSCAGRSFLQLVEHVSEPSSSSAGHFLFVDSGSVFGLLAQWESWVEEADKPQ